MSKTAAVASILVLLFAVLVWTQSNLLSSSSSSPGPAATAPTTGASSSSASASTMSTAAPALTVVIAARKINSAVDDTTIKFDVSSAASLPRSQEYERFLELVAKTRSQKSSKAKSANSKNSNAADGGDAADDETSSSAVAVEESSPLELQLLRFVNTPLSEPRPTPPGLCPRFSLRVGKDADSKVTMKVVSKYNRYTQDFCNTTGMLQMHFKLLKFIKFADIIASILRIRPGSLILDVGSGCGTLLNYYALKLNTTGHGIDITGEAVQHSKMHARPNQHFCRMDATMLRLFPTATYDYIVSWAVLYHIRRTQVQCAVLLEICRLLKPGASAVLAQMRTEKSQNYWRKGKCRTLPWCSWRRMSDTNTFREKSFSRNGFFSILMTRKLNDSEPLAIGSSSINKDVPEE